jgi:beta-aspartyl-peptidase (threonine type)
VGKSPIVIIGSQRSEAGLPAGMDVLRAGGTALDAVEAAMWRCEDNGDDHYVGTGGLPNAQGVVELDAAVMVGSTRAFGGVGAVRGYPHPISIARAVLEQLPQHCLLVGEGAELFADEQGFKRAELLTEESARLFRTSLALADGGDSETARVTPENEAYRTTALELVRRLAPHDGPWGTINVQRGDLLRHEVRGGCLHGTRRAHHARHRGSDGRRRARRGLGPHDVVLPDAPRGGVAPRRVQLGRPCPVPHS